MMAAKKVPLECSECGRRNYNVSVSNHQAQRLELKKFCKQCGKVTLHRQSR